MMKKLMLICTCLLLALTLFGCDSSDDVEEPVVPEVEEVVEPEVEPEEEEFEIDWDAEEEMTGDEQPYVFDPANIPEIIGVHNPELVEALLIEGAYVYTDVEGFLVFRTDLSMNETIEFFLEAVEELEATIIGIVEPWPDTWSLDFEMEGALFVHVEVRDNEEIEDEDGVSVMVIY